MRNLDYRPPLLSPSGGNTKGGVNRSDPEAENILILKQKRIISHRLAQMDMKKE